MYQVRLWNQRDLPWLRQAVVASSLETVHPAERQHTTAHAVAGRAIERLESTLSTPQATAVIAHWGLEPVGFALLAASPEGTTKEMQSLLVDLWVEPDHRRRGVGQMLSQAAEALTVQAGFRKLKIWMQAANKPALELARKAGYQIEGLVKEKSLLT